MSKKHTKDFVKKICEAKNIQVLSKYLNSKTKIELKCMTCFYLWSGTFNHIKNNDSGCPKCANNIPLTYEYVKNFLKEKNIQLLSDSYINTKTPLKLCCMVCNNIWRRSLDGIKNPRLNRGCPSCKGGVRLTYECVKNFLKEKNIILLSDCYKNNRTKLLLKCEICLKQWNGVFDSIKNGNTGCPFCNFPGHSQVKLFEIIKELFPKYNVCFNYKKFDWLKNKKRMELDIFVKDLKLAIEYDGEQHFREKSWFAGQQFKDLQERDKLKNKLIQENRNDVKYFIRIPYTEKLTKQNIKKLLTLNGVSL